MNQITINGFPVEVKKGQALIINYSDVKDIVSGNVILKRKYGKLTRQVFKVNKTVV